MPRTADPTAAEAKGALVESVVRARQLSNEWLRRAVIHGNRIDLLATEILGLVLKPEIHWPILNCQMVHRTTHTVGFRGSGKTEVGTILKAIHLILKHPDIRILFVSKTARNVMNMLRKVKAIFESHPRFREVFGNWVGEEVWEMSMIQVNRRTQFHKEPTIMTVGADSTLASAHVNVIFPDDVVEWSNSRTPHQRERLKDWFYKVVLPCLDPPTDEHPYSGQVHGSGTFYHWDDLNVHWMKNEMANSSLRIPIYDPQTQELAWPERYGWNYIEERRVAMGAIRWALQYMCDEEIAKGSGVFEWSDLQPDKGQPPLEQLETFLGVDPAASQAKTADRFSLAILGKEKAAKPMKKRRGWVLDAWAGKLRFGKQTDLCIKYADKWKIRRAVIESNGYQLAQYQALVDKRPDIMWMPHPTTRDKDSRAIDLSAKFESGLLQIGAHPTRGVDELVRTLIAYPELGRDMFDAMDLAETACYKRRRKRREYEPGVIGGG